MSKFWDKVDQCKHDNLYENYCEPVPCSTPYCSGYETHCKDCKVYISKCGCGSENGMSGWSRNKWNNKGVKNDSI